MDQELERKKEVEIKKLHKISYRNLKKMQKQKKILDVLDNLEDVIFNKMDKSREHSKRNNQLIKEMMNHYSVIQKNLECCQ